MRARRFCFVLLVAATLAAACSGASATFGGAAYPPDLNYGQEKPTAAPTFLGAAVEATMAAGPISGGANPTGAAAAGTPNAAQPENQIIKTGTISVQVPAVDDSITRATAQIHGLGGWLAGSDRTTSTAEDVASVTYRVPVIRFEDALDAMRKLGTKVLSEHTESTPVGGEIVDLQARIANLRASEKAIQAIMEKATTIGDVLTVQQRLAEVQGQIEELSGQLAGLTDQSAYSTLTVVFVVPILPTPSPSLTPTPSPSPTATPVAWSAGDQAGQAAGALGEVGKGTASVLIWLAILVVPITIALIFLLVLLGLAGRLLEPYRKRLLPFTVPQPVTFVPPAWPVQGQSAAGQLPDDKPKA